MQSDNHLIDEMMSQQRQIEIYNEFKLAIRNINYDKVNELLNQYQKALDLTNRIDPQTRQITLYLAAGIADDQSCLQMIKILVTNGAVLTFKDHIQQTILFYCARDGKVAVLDYLIQSGLDINERDIYNQTPLFYASRDNRLEFVKRMIELNVDVNHVDNLSNQTALFYAAREGHLEMCKILMENGCNPNHQDVTKRTALYFAKKGNKKEVVELLNNYMARIKDDIKPIQQLPQQDVSVASVEKKKSKKDKEVNKQIYRIIYTDDNGNQKELTIEEFEQFQKEFPETAQLLINADDMIDETMISQIKEEENWEKSAKKIMAQIWKSKGAFFFHQPVDPKKYGIDDYFDIVKNPMDFGTIKNKLNQNVYESCQEFIKDVHQVFENCLLYNGTEHEVGKVGLAIHAEFKQLLAQYNLHSYIKQQ